MPTEPEKKGESCEGVATAISASDGKRLFRAEARQVAERQLVRKLDIRLLPIIAVIFLMNYIDRLAITTARLKGLQADLGLSDVQYDTVVAILYVSYCPGQIPSNIAINYISRPSLYIGICVVLWGLTSALTGLTQNFGGIVACRIFLGLPESVFYPGSIYLLSRWYTRKELALRFAIPYSAILLSTTLGSLWAAGILGSMDRVMGIAAWRWLFYIQGSITILLGFLSMWLLPDYPNNTKWLSPTERRLAQIRLAEDVGEADQDSQQAPLFEGLKLALKDPKVLLFMLMTHLQVLGLSFSNFFPTLTATLGYSTTDTLLMAAPPWIFATIAGLINARHADITGERFFHLATWWWIVIIGYIISLSTMRVAGRYFSMFLMTCGNCGAMLTLVWVANVVPRPPAKRSAAIGLVDGFGTLGNVAGAYIWRADWGPQYHPSMAIALSALILATLVALVIRVLLVRENTRMERAERDLMMDHTHAHGLDHERIAHTATLEGIPLDEALRRRMGFRYLY